MRRALLPLLAAAAALAGCGAETPDLFAVQRIGSIPGARLGLVVNDAGTARCNGGRSREVPAPLLLDARELQRDLAQPASQGLELPPGPGSVLRYDVRTQDGRVRFADDSAGKPPVLDRLMLLVRQLAQRVCGLAR